MNVEPTQIDVHEVLRASVFVDIRTERDLQYLFFFRLGRIVHVLIITVQRDGDIRRGQVELVHKVEHVHSRFHFQAEMRIEIFQSLQHEIQSDLRAAEFDIHIKVAHDRVDKGLHSVRRLFDVQYEVERQVGVNVFEVHAEIGEVRRFAAFQFLNIIGNVLFLEFLRVTLYAAVRLRRHGIYGLVRFVAVFVQI